MVFFLEAFDFSDQVCKYFINQLFVYCSCILEAERHDFVTI